MAEWWDVFDSVADERLRQETKWGDSKLRPPPKFRHLMEEVGEAAQARNDMANATDPAYAVRDELVHVAAVAVAMIEAIDRGDTPD